MALLFLVCGSLDANMALPRLSVVNKFHPVVAMWSTLLQLYHQSHYSKNVLE
jgi:hypothetical protein